MYTLCKISQLGMQIFLYPNTLGSRIQFSYEVKMHWLTGVHIGMQIFSTIEMYYFHNQNTLDHRLKHRYAIFFLTENALAYI